MSARRHTEHVFAVVITERGTDCPPAVRYFDTQRAAEACAARWGDEFYRVSMARYERAPWPRSRSHKRAA